MCVCSDHRRDAPIKIPTQRNFFTGGLRVHIHQDESNVRRKLGQLFVCFLERVVVGSKKDAALQVEHGELHACFRLSHK